MKTIKTSHLYKRVVVGLSGGVDSSVAAALLKEQGFEVVAVYMKNWNTDSPTLGTHRLDKDQYRMDCPWYQDYLDAKRVALKLEIPFYLWDFREEYKKKVFDHFIDEAASGRTPNPDIYCNSLIKFADFRRRAKTELQADYVATGHYARLVESESGEYQLQTPADTVKDQTYFLYRLSQEQLASALFPLADYTKKEVRQLAKKFDLPTSHKADSQGICFIGEVDVRQFLAQWLAPKEGEIVDEQGQKLGTHAGVHLYTIGERVAVDNGLVAKLHPNYRSAIPHYFIADKLIKENRLVVVVGADNPTLFKMNIIVSDPVFSLPPTDLTKQPIFARVRHGGAKLPVLKLTIDKKDGQISGFQVQLAEPVRAIAAGQHLVCYDSTGKVLAGGVMTGAD